jgi:aminopeptidase N
MDLLGSAAPLVGWMPRFLLAVGGVVAFVATANTAEAAQFLQQPDVEVTRYDFGVTLTDDSDVVQMTETVGVSLGRGAKVLSLDLCGVQTAPVGDSSTPDACLRGAPSYGPKISGSESTKPGMVVTSATINGAATSFQQTSNKVAIDLSGISDRAHPCVIVLHYHGTPRLGLFIGRTKYGHRYFATVPWPDLNHHWVAIIDNILEKTPLSVTVTAPATYQVVSNGVLRQQIDLPMGQRRTTWVEDAPIPAWTFSLVVTNYAVDNLGEAAGIPLSSWVFPEEAAMARDAFRQMSPSILNFYLQRVGPYPYAKLAQLQSPMEGGGLELASNILYGFSGAPDRAVVAHEIAHQWFGNGVTEASWDDVWLSEGFATYFALLYLEYADGHDAFMARVRSSADEAINYSLAHPEFTIVHKNLENVSQVISNTPQIYQGGAQVLHMLRGLIGDDAFWRAIQLYYQRFRDKHASTADFQRAVEDACTSRHDCPAEAGNLQWFFDQWLRRGGVPQLTGSWSYDSSAKVVQLDLAQTQSGEPYRLMFDVSLRFPQPTPVPTKPSGASQRIVMNGRRVTLAIPSELEPAEVELDPRSWVSLMQARMQHVR